MSFPQANYDTTQILVNSGGVLNATTTTFINPGNAYESLDQIAVASGGEFIAASSTLGLDQLYLESGSILNQGDLTNDVFNLPIYVPALDLPLLNSNQSFQDVYLSYLGGSLSSGQSLALNLIGTQSTANLLYIFPSGFTVNSGAILTVADDVSVQIGAGQTIADDGTITFSSGDQVSFPQANYDTTQILVNSGGILNATATTFINPGNAYESLDQIAVASGGEFIAANSTLDLDQLYLESGSILNQGDLTNDVFNLPIYVPALDLPLLTSNQSFQDVYLSYLGGSLGSGQSLALNLIGTQSTADLLYIFPSGFTVNSGATLKVADDVTVQIGAGQTITDDGMLTFGLSDAVSFPTANYDTTQIVVNGSLSATGVSLNNPGNAYESSTQISVGSGGNLSINDSVFGLNQLTLNSGSSATMSTDVLSGVFAINSNTTLNITGNDFSKLNTPNGLVAAGTPSATIPLSGNYWGTDAAGIEAIIYDHNKNANLPTVNFQPFISYSSGTSASPVTRTFSPTQQTFNLTATVSTTAGLVISEGTETFAIFNGTVQIGQTTAPAQVQNGSATATYTLPAGTPAALYTIEAIYSGSSNYLPATDTSHFLTLNPAATTTTVGNASATFNSASDQTVPLSAQISSTAGTVNEGTVTFTILSGGNPVGSPVTANVVNDAASASYDLLAGTAGGSYSIETVYSDPVDFKTSTGTNQLTVSAAATTITPSSAATTFNTVTGEGITLSANVSSPAGTINQGAVTFTILNSSSQQVVPPIVVNVSNGIASNNYILPAGTSVGSYTIAAEYDGTSSYAASLPSNSTLTISGATTSIAASNASIGYNAAAQSAPLTATVTSPGGTVNEGMVTFTILSGATTIGSPVTANVASGTASTSYPLPATFALGTYTIKAVYNGTGDFGGSSDSTHVLTVTQPPAYQLAIGTAPSSAAIAGQAFAVQPVIDEKDQFDNLETGDNTTVITATISTGPGSLLGTVTATVVGGVATFTGLGDQTAGTITIAFSSGDLVPVTSGNIKINPAAASQLVVTQEPPAGATAGQAFTRQPVVEEEDQYNNVITTDSTHTVMAARGGIGTASLQGNTLTVTLVNGVATFSGLSYDKAESMDLSFTTNASGVSSTSSSTVSVSPTTASQLVIFQQPSATATVGLSIATGPVIYLEDQYNNIESGDNSTVVTTTLNTGAGPLQGTTATVSGGVARFSNLIDDKAETISLSFTSGILTSSPSSSIVVSAAPASKLVIATQPSTTATAGQPFAVQPVIYIEDQDGDIETTDNSTVVSVALSSGDGLPEGTTSVTVKNGVATFAGLNETTAGVIALEFSGGGFTAGPSNNITVSPATPFRLTIATQPAATATAGRPFGTQPLIDELDLYGNLETTDSSTLITAAVTFGNGPLPGTTTVSLVGGVATFTNLAETLVGTIALGFSGGGLSVGPSNQIVISPGPAAQLVIATQPFPAVTAGHGLTDPIVIDEEDRYGNIVTGDDSTVVTAALSSGPGKLIGTTTATVTHGVASYNDVEDDAAGTLSLGFSAPGLPVVISDPSVVSAAPASEIKVISGPPAGTGAGTSFELVADAYDPYGNVATSFNGPVTVALANGSVGALNGVLTVTAVDGVATFSGLNDPTSGPISLNVSATAGTVTGANSGNVTLAPNIATKLIVQIQPSQSATAGSAFATQPVVREEDQFGNLETSDSSTVVTAFVSSGVGRLLGAITATMSGGIATFSNVAADTADAIALAFTGSGLTSPTSVPIVVSPAAASKLMVLTEPSPTATAGGPFAIQPVIEELDQYGNLETGDSSTPVTVTLASGTGPVQGTATATVTKGVATFTGLADNRTGTTTLKFSSGTLTSAISAPITVTSGSATQLVVTTEPPSTDSVGQAFGLVVSAKDKYGNPASSYSGDVSLALASNPGGTRLTGITTVAAVDGVATFAGLTLNNAGNGYTLNATGNGLAPVSTTPFTVSPPGPISNPSTAPTISNEQVFKLKLKNSKGKPTGKTALEFSLKYSTTMNQAGAGLATNYQVETAIIKGTKKKKTTAYKSVAFTESYNAETNTVTLSITGSQPFTSGGKIIVNAAPPNGVANASGVPLYSNDTNLSIGTKANSITIG